MNIKCYQCGEEIEKTHVPNKKIFYEICFKCGYVRKIIWNQMDVNNEISDIMDIVENEKLTSEQKVTQIAERFSIVAINKEELKK